MTKAVAQIRTILLVFAATILGLVVTGGVDLLSLNGWSDWKPYVTAGVAAVAVYVYKFLSPFDPAYGVGAGK